MQMGVSCTHAWDDWTSERNTCKLCIYVYNYLEKYSEWKPKGSNQCHNRPSKVATRSAVCGSPDGRHACTASFWWSSLGWSAHSTRSILLASFLAARNCQTKWFNGYVMLSVHTCSRFGHVHPLKSWGKEHHAGQKDTTEFLRLKSKFDRHEHSGIAQSAKHDWKKVLTDSGEG